MRNYDKDKLFTIPSAFTALNGCVQNITLEAGVDLVVEPEYDDDGEMTNADAVKEAQDNLLRVLEILRSNGAQPIITKVEGKTVSFTLEQAHVYGVRGNMQVSARKGGENEFASLEEGAKHDIETIFGKAKAVDGKTKLFGKATVEDAIGSLVK